MSRFSRKIQRSHKPKSRTAIYIAIALVLLFLLILLTQMLITRYTGQNAPADTEQPRDSSLHVVIVSALLGLALLGWILLSRRQKK